MGWQIAKRSKFWIVAVNQAVCATIFFPWFRPRETVSGLMGRWCATERGWKLALARPMVRLLNSTIHCVETCHRVYELEEEARRVLYQPHELP